MSDTTPDPTADDIVLASAYLDGEATPDERARVEASDELLAEVERLRQVRAVVGASVEPPTLSTREASLAAALDVWDRMSDRERAGEATPTSGVDAAAVAAITTPTARSRRRDRRSRSTAGTWLLGAAAAVVVLAGAGLVVRTAITGDDDATDSAADAPAEVGADAADSEAIQIEDRAAEEFATGESEDGVVPSVESDDVATDVEASDAGAAAAAEAPADTAAAEMADEAADAESAEEPASTESAAADDGVAPEAEQPAPPGDDELPLLTEADELADFGALAAYAPVADDDAPDVDVESPFVLCEDRYDFDVIAGPALVGSAEDPVEAVVGVDLDRELVIAYAELTCNEIARAPLPSEDEFLAGDTAVVDTSP